MFYKNTLIENKLMMKFKVIFTFNSEYQGCVSEVSELPACVSQGKTLDEVVENIKDAIRGYLHVQAKHGNPYVVQESQSLIGEVVV
ncbi:HicB family protein [cyanobacterium TDX16]|nr:HicB family protein [cyanobacterium TDX16]